jgi:hypothetical protein
MNKFVKVALASGLAAGLGISAALANETQITIDANVQDFQGLYIETTNDLVVSDDTVDERIGGIMSTLDFGDVDAFGVSGGSVSSADHTVPVATVSKALLVGGVIQPLNYNTTALAPTDGALYYIDSQTTGYQLRYLTNTTEDLDINVEVQDGANDALSALVELSANEDYTAGTSTPNIVIPNAPDVPLGTLVNDTPQNLDLGVFVPRNQPAGQTSTVIVFTGS